MAMLNNQRVKHQMIVNPSSMVQSKYFGHIALLFDSEIHRTKPSEKYHPSLGRQFKLVIGGSRKTRHYHKHSMITNNDQIWILSIPGAQFHLMWYALIDSMKYQADMEVSWHRATPKSSILFSDFPPEKPSIYGVPPFMETHIWLYLNTPKNKNALNAAAAKLEGSELGSEGHPWPQIGIKTHCHVGQNPKFQRVKTSFSHENCNLYGHSLCSDCGETESRSRQTISASYPVQFVSSTKVIMMP